MRYSCLILACCLAGGSAAAQNPIPDTTDWHTYLPLEIGNSWQFLTLDEPVPSGGLADILRGWIVESDTTINEDVYFVLQTCFFEVGDPVSCLGRDFIRYALTGALLVEFDTGSGTESWWSEIPCGLDAPFRLVHGECEGMPLFTAGGYDTYVQVGPDVTGPLTAKYLTNSGNLGHTLAAGIGLVHHHLNGDPFYRTLQHARVGPKEYGLSMFEFPTATEPTAVPSDRALSVDVWPNPTQGRVSILVRSRLHHSPPVEISVYDLLGRRPLGEFSFRIGSIPSETNLDLGQLAPGTYTLHITSGEETTTRKLTIIR